MTIRGVVSALKGDLSGCEDYRLTLNGKRISYAYPDHKNMQITLVLEGEDHEVVQEDEQVMAEPVTSEYLIDKDGNYELF